MAADVVGQEKDGPAVFHLHAGGSGRPVIPEAENAGLAPVSPALGDRLLPEPRRRP